MDNNSKIEKIILIRLAQRITDHGMGVPAVFFLEMTKYMSFLGSQILVFFGPIITSFVQSDPYYKLAELMGLAQAQLANGALKTVEVNCYGSAEDSKSISLAFLKGLLSNITDNRINFINAAAIAKERGVKFSHMYSNDNMPYLNVIESKVSSDNENITIMGSVYGDNHIRIVNIMGFDIDLRPSGTMLFLKNRDVPGVVGNVGTILGNNNVNISGYLLSKMKNKDFAYSVIKIDNNINKQIIDEINLLPEIMEVRQLHL